MWPLKDWLLCLIIFMEEILVGVCVGGGVGGVGGLHKISERKRRLPRVRAKL